MNSCKKKLVADIIVYYKESQIKTLQLIELNIAEALRLLNSEWNLGVPENSRIYIMDDWKEFLYQASPVYYWPLVCIYIILVSPRMKKTWKSIGGWTKSYGNRNVIGVKDITQISNEGGELGGKIFLPNENIEKVSNILTHELAHLALANHNKPEWFNEGFAMLTVDLLQKKQTVRADTLNILANYTHQSVKDDLLCNYVVGYWFVRFIYETQPERLREVITRNTISEDKLFSNLSFDDFKGQVVSHYSQLN